MPDLKKLHYQSSAFKSFEVKRDPEDRLVASGDVAAIREKMLDKTLADSYPASDPPSTIPNPSDDSLCPGDTEGSQLYQAA